MTVPRPYCPSCKRPMQPAEVLLARCPHCDAPFDAVLVDAVEWRRALAEERART